MTEIADKIVLLQGDLTGMDTDAIVNAANNDLQLGGGVAGAIRRKGGEQIQRECDSIGSVPVGGAAITSGGGLRARHVIHAASMQLGGATTAQALRSSTAHSLRIAAQNNLKTIAFPAVGTGIAGFPMRECAEIMLAEAQKHLQSATSLEQIKFVLFDKKSLKVFEQVWKEMKK
ncbi:MAG TPA: macro domain-containing protein [Candidatus Acidoferrales bacterium]|nr:macro domain-containing protein [Candidatus Acidoferrales bacterium]